jgi:hypothetical protein
MLQPKEGGNQVGLGVPALVGMQIRVDDPDKRQTPPFRAYMDAPPLCQAFRALMGPTGIDCTRTFGLWRETASLSLMGFAGWLPIGEMHSRC